MITIEGSNFPLQRKLWRVYENRLLVLWGLAAQWCSLVDTFQYLFDDSLVANDLRIKTTESSSHIDPPVEGVMQFANGKTDVHCHWQDETNYQMFELDAKFTSSRL